MRSTATLSAVLAAVQARKTVLSPCRAYRYTAWRQWLGGSGYVLMLGLNPSTADEVQDDATIRREISFAKSWGFEALAKANLFAFRATDPGDMLAAPDPVGPDNDAHILALAQGADSIIAVWGNHGEHRERDAQVLKLLRRHPIHALKLTQRGQPQHSLYLKASLRPVLWQPAGRM